jgi:hypothetical protein
VAAMPLNASRLIYNGRCSVLEKPRSPGLAYRPLNESDNERFGTLEVAGCNFKISWNWQKSAPLRDRRCDQRPGI